MNVSSVVEAEEKEIALIVQEIGTIEDISVAANIFPGNEKKFSKNGIIQYRKMSEEAKTALELIGITNINPDERTGSDNLEERKIIESVKAFYLHPKLMIVDETANALSSHGRSILYSVMKKVKEYGGSVYYP